MTALVVLASFMRYLVGSPFRFTEELVGLLYLGTKFLTMPNSTAKRQHIAVSLVTSWAGARLRRLLDGAGHLVMVLFCGWFMVEGWRFAAFAKDLGARSEQVDILLWPWMAVMPAIMAIVGLVALAQLLRLLAGGAPPASAAERGEGALF